MRKDEMFGPYTQPYLHTRGDKQVSTSDRKLLLQLLLVILAVAALVVFVFYYRHMQGWQVIQK